MCGAIVVDCLIGDPNFLRNFFFDFFIGNKQSDLDQYPLFYTISNEIGSRLPTPSSQSQVSCPKPKNANQ